MNPIRRWLIRRANRREDRVRCPQCWAMPDERHTLSCPHTSAAEFKAAMGWPSWIDCDDCGARAGLDEHHPECTVTQGERAESEQRLTDHWHTAPKERT